MIALPALPYAYDGLEPVISEITMRTHHDKHHARYVDVTNTLLAETPTAGSTLEEIVTKAWLRSARKLFNNAAQAWNHGFFWQCLTPDPPELPEALREALRKSFGTVEAFTKQFSDAAAEVFGSGWTWLIQKRDGALVIVSTANAGTPLTQAHKPLLTCDVWEHAYYIDRRNERPAYLKHYWRLVNWEFVAGCLQDPKPWIATSAVVRESLRA